MTYVSSACEKANPAIAEASLFKVLADALDGLPEPQPMFGSSLWGAEALLVWKVESVSALTELLAALPPMFPTAFIRGGGIEAVKPAHLAKESDTVELTEPVHLKIDGASVGCSPKEAALALSWMSTTAGRSVQVTVELFGSALNERMPRVAIRSSLTNGEIRYATSLERRAFRGGSIRWDRGASLPAEYSLYFTREKSDDPLAFPQLLSFLKSIA